MSVEFVPKKSGSTSMGVSNGQWFWILNNTDIGKIVNPRNTNDPIDATENDALRCAEVLEKVSLPKTKGGVSSEQLKTYFLKKIAKAHEKVVNQRIDYFYKLAHRLCRKYKTICLEDLCLTGMSKLWGRKVKDLSFGKFVKILEHIALKYDTVIQKVGRFFASSKKCNKCGFIYKELKLWEREWICPCGQIHNRDENAAINIELEGIRLLQAIV